MPTPSTNCHDRAAWPVQPSPMMTSAARQPKSRGEPSARLAVPRTRAELPRGAEIELDAGEEDEQHHRPPGDAVQRLIAGGEDEL
jgi:hypothetical protein